MEAAEKELTAKQAIETGFRLFHDLVAETSTVALKRILLEGIEYLESHHRWRVIIGFEAGGSKTKSAGYPGIATLLGSEQTTEPVRETREFLLDAKDGSLVRMT